MVWFKDLFNKKLEFNIDDLDKLVGKNILLHGKECHIKFVNKDDQKITCIINHNPPSNDININEYGRESITVPFTLTGGSRRRKRVSRKRKCKKSYKRKTYCKRRRLIKSTK